MAIGPSYAVEHGYRVEVYKVTNQKFFSRFDWLKPDFEMSFVSTFRPI